MTDATTDADTAGQGARANTAASTGDGGPLLASAVSYNALFSATSGVALSAGAPLLSEPIGLPSSILVTLGVGLVGFAVLLLWLLDDVRRLAQGAPLVVLADVAWVLAAAVLLVSFPSLLAPAGQIGLVAVSVVVAALAAAQAVGLRRRGTGPMTAASPVHLQVERIVAAPPEQGVGGCLGRRRLWTVRARHRAHRGRRRRAGRDGAGLSRRPRGRVGRDVHPVGGGSRVSRQGARH